jgi:hypothetical protein
LASHCGNNKIDSKSEAIPSLEVTSIDILQTLYLLKVGAEMSLNADTELNLCSGVPYLTPLLPSILLDLVPEV